MSCTKKSIKARAATRVRFRISQEQSNNNAAIYVAGTFNNWDEYSLPMKKQKDGSFMLEIELPAGEKHLFRYVGADGLWFNDPEADAYEPSGFAGVYNCVLRV